MDYEGVGIIQNHAYTKVSVTKVKGVKAANFVRSCTVVCNKGVKCGERISEA